MDIREGIEGKEEMVVGEKDLATAVGSGTVEVFATPALAALMERASWKLVQRYLPEGFTTVGTKLSLTHLWATPPGMKVVCTAVLVRVEKKRARFRAESLGREGLDQQGRAYPVCRG